MAGSPAVAATTSFCTSGLSNASLVGAGNGRGQRVHSETGVGWREVHTVPRLNVRFQRHRVVGAGGSSGANRSHLLSQEETEAQRQEGAGSEGPGASLFVLLPSGGACHFPLRLPFRPSSPPDHEWGARLEGRRVSVRRLQHLAEPWRAQSKGIPSRAWRGGGASGPRSLSFSVPRRRPCSTWTGKESTQKSLPGLWSWCVCGMLCVSTAGPPPYLWLVSLSSPCGPPGHAHPCTLCGSSLHPSLSLSFLGSLVFVLPRAAAQLQGASHPHLFAVSGPFPDSLGASLTCALFLAASLAVFFLSLIFPLWACTCMCVVPPPQTHAHTVSAPLWPGAGSSPRLKAQLSSPQAGQQEGSPELEPRAPAPLAALMLSLLRRFCVRVYSGPPWPSSRDSWEPVRAWPSLAWKVAPVWEQECPG